MIDQHVHGELEHLHRELRELALRRPRIDRPDPYATSAFRALLEKLGQRPARVAYGAGRRIPDVTLRPALAADRDALVALAEICERRIPVGMVLLAEVESDIAAALPLDGGPLLTDLRRPMADVAQLLQLRSEQFRSSRRHDRAA